MSLIEGLFNHDFVHSRVVRFDTGQGGWAVAHEVLGTVRGRLRPMSGSEVEVAKEEQRAVSHVFYCLHGMDVQRDDLLYGDGITVRVLGVREPSRAGHHLEVDCLEIQQGATEEPGS